MSVAEHLRKTFPGKGKDKTPVVAVDDVGFEACDGEITGLLGPHGDGKTTTLRMLYSLMSPQSGRELVHGRDVATDPDAARPALGILQAETRTCHAPNEHATHQYFAELHVLPRPPAN